MPRPTGLAGTRQRPRPDRAYSALPRQIQDRRIAHDLEPFGPGTAHHLNLKLTRIGEPGKISKIHMRERRQIRTVKYIFGMEFRMAAVLMISPRLMVVVGMLFVARTIRFMIMLFIAMGVRISIVAMLIMVILAMLLRTMGMLFFIMMGMMMRIPFQNNAGTAQLASRRHGQLEQIQRMRQDLNRSCNCGTVLGTFRCMFKTHNISTWGTQFQCNSGSIERDIQCTNPMFVGIKLAGTFGKRRNAGSKD